MCDAFLLDIDGTLLTTRAGYYALEAVLVRTLGSTCSLAALDTAGQTDCGIVATAMESVGAPANRAVIGAILDAYDAGIPTSICTHGVKDIRGARRLAGWLLDRHIDVRCATGNTQVAARAKLEAAGLADLIPGAVCGDLHTTRDEMLRCATYGAARRYIVVGDTVRDMTAARAVGALAVGVLTGGTTKHDLYDAGAAVVLDSVDDIIGWYARHQEPTSRTC